MDNCIHIKDLYFLRACEFLNVDDLRGAARDFEKAFRLYPKNDPIHSKIISPQLARCYDLSGQFEKSEALYREQIKDDPFCPSGHCALGNNLTHQGRYDEAVLILRKAIRFGHDQCAEVHCGLGKAYEGQMKFELAIEEYRSAIQADPFCFEALMKMKEIIKSWGSP